MNFVIFDFEVFRYDTLLGCIVIDENDNKQTIQMWNEDDIRSFYALHIDDVWIGHNNKGYDNLILQGIINHEKNIFALSKSLINARFRPRLTMHLNYYDTMLKFFSLKSCELACGRKMYTTEVDFNLNRQLTEEEKKQTEVYNRHDLEQTLFDFYDDIHVFKLRCNIMREFHLPFNTINCTQAQIASKVLHCKPIPNIESMYRKPELYSTLRLKNKDLIDFYLSEGFRQNKKLQINICGLTHYLGSGGIHSAIPKCHLKKVLYFDVSGYYNLIMINYDLLSRTIPQEYKELYKFMYHEQLRLKKENPALRGVYKVILLAVFGAQMNKYTDFYDPQTGSLVMIVGQLFLVDLLEKLEESKLCYIVQTNTDGLMIEPYDWNDRDKIVKIVEEWEARTGFTIKKLNIYNLWQRDVNNYVYSSDEGNTELVVKGEAVSACKYDVNRAMNGGLYGLKESIIIAIGIVNFLIYNIKPEETVDKYKNDLRYFQQYAKKGVYSYQRYVEYDLCGNILFTEDIPGFSRIFAKKVTTTIGKVYKFKETEKGISKSIIPLAPDNVIVNNDDIVNDTENIAKIKNDIDYQWYVDRIYDRIKEFIPFVEDITI